MSVNINFLFKFAFSCTAVRHESNNEFVLFGLQESSYVERQKIIIVLTLQWQQQLIQQCETFLLKDGKETLIFNSVVPTSHNSFGKGDFEFVCTE